MTLFIISSTFLKLFIFFHFSFEMTNGVALIFTSDRHLAQTVKMRDSQLKVISLSLETQTRR